MQQKHKQSGQRWEEEEERPGCEWDAEEKGEPLRLWRGGENRMGWTSETVHVNGLFQKRNVSETVEPQVELLSGTARWAWGTQSAVHETS